MHSKLLHFILFQFHLIISYSNTFSQKIHIIESSDDQIILEIDFNNSFSIIVTLIDSNQYQIILGENQLYGIPGNPLIPEYLVHIGIPPIASGK